MLEEIFEEDWNWELLDNPEFAYQAGQYDMAQKGRPLQSVSISSYQERSAHSKLMVQKNKTILKEEGSSLDTQQLLFANIFLKMHEELCDCVDNCPFYLMPINSTGVGCVTFSLAETVEWMRFESFHDFEVYLKVLKSFHTQVDENIDCLREGISRGFVASAAMTHDVDKQLSDLISSDLSMFLDPLSTPAAAAFLPAEHPLRSELVATVSEVRLGLVRFRDFFRSEYIGALRPLPACSSLPDGAAAYARCLRFHTTTDLDAPTIYAMGLREVANIETRMRTEVMEPLGWPASRGGFVDFTASLRADGRYYAGSAEDLLEMYRGVVADIQAVLPRYFLDFPKSPLEITTRTVGPSAFYLAGTADGTRPGRFYVNVADLSQQPTYEAVALALHEGVPGHHHQVSLAAEDRGLPPFLRVLEDRRYEVCPCRRNMFSSFIEGWALYCEYLGEEMGMYRTKEALFGRLSMDMMRAVRLVVDTGLHALGWSLERCVDYFAEKTGLHREEAEREVRRYAAWPGQAVAYKVGQLEFLRLRREAEAALGAGFDLREWHRMLLSAGPCPLSDLASRSSNFVRRQLDAAAAAAAGPGESSKAA